MGNDEAVKVFRTTDGWDTRAEIEITAADGEAYDDFGDSVAIDGTTVVVGAYWTYKGGAAYVFRLTDDGYEEVATYGLRRRGGRWPRAVDGQHRGGCRGCQNAGGAAYFGKAAGQRDKADDGPGKYEFGAAVAMDALIRRRCPGGWDGTRAATIFGPPAIARACSAGARARGCARGRLEDATAATAAPTAMAGTAREETPSRGLAHVP